MSDHGKECTCALCFSETLKKFARDLGAIADSVKTLQREAVFAAGYPCQLCGGPAKVCGGCP